MPITAADLKLYISAVQSDSSSNGGRMSNIQAITNVKNSVFPDITISERTSGVTRFRKAFLKPESASNDIFQNADIFLESVTPGPDRVVMFPGTLEGTQSSDTTSPPRLYGVGVLDSSVAAAATSIDVLIEDSADTLFIVGDTIRISDKDSVSDVSNNEEYRVLTSVNSVGSVITLGFADGLSNAYSDTTTKVSSLYEAGSIVAASTGVSVVSAGDGSYNSTTNNILVRQDSTVHQVWTLTFTSGSAFTISGDTLGVVGTGTVSTGASPSNPVYSDLYFDMAAAGFSGTWAAGDTIVFTTTPAAVPIWLKQIVLPGSAALGSDFTVLAIRGESA